MSNIDIFAATAARVAQWSTQPEVVGVLLVGSKSRGHADALSDDDLEVLLTDEALAQRVPTDCIELLQEGEGTGQKLIYDAQYTSYSELKLKLSSPLDMDHWPAEEGVPRPAQRTALFCELIHPSRTAERAIHGMY